MVGQLTSRWAKFCEILSHNVRYGIYASSGDFGKSNGCALPLVFNCTLHGRLRAHKAVDVSASFCLTLYSFYFIACEKF